MNWLTLKDILGGLLSLSVLLRLKVGFSEQYL